jgi:predicted kinase
MKMVKIMSGVSGSGKSYEAARLLANFDNGKNYPHSVISVSADQFFLVDGEYRFDADKLSEAHAWCFRRFLDSLSSGTNLVVVDNTNTTNEEIAPYILGAQAYNYQAEILTVWVDEGGGLLGKCLARNKHQVPASVIMSQQSRLAKRRLLPWWKSSVIPATF